MISQRHLCPPNVTSSSPSNQKWPAFIPVEGRKAGTKDGGKLHTLKKTPKTVPRDAKMKARWRSAQRHWISSRTGRRSPSHGPKRIFRRNWGCLRFCWNGLRFFQIRFLRSPLTGMESDSFESDSFESDSFEPDSSQNGMQ